MVSVGQGIMLRGGCQIIRSKAMSPILWSLAVVSLFRNRSGKELDGRMSKRIKYVTLWATTVPYAHLDSWVKFLLQGQSLLLFTFAILF